MNRRKFLRGSLIAGSLSVLGLGGYKIYSVFHKPDYNYLLQNKTFIAEVCETLLPRTDTPGAKDAKVEDFVIHYTQNIIEASEANTFIDGLKFINRYCNSNFNAGYVNCSHKNRLEAIHAADSLKIFKKYPILTKVRNRLIGRNFVHLLKDMTAIGYCTSEVGATRGLAYEHIPVKFIACMPLKNGQRSWATK